MNEKEKNAVSIRKFKARGKHCFNCILAVWKEGPTHAIKRNVWQELSRPIICTLLLLSIFLKENYKSHHIPYHSVNLIPSSMVKNMFLFYFRSPEAQGPLAPVGPGGNLRCFRGVFWYNCYFHREVGPTSERRSWNASDVRSQEQQCLPAGSKGCFHRHEL